jgi:hypothetical protein
LLVIAAPSHIAASLAQTREKLDLLRAVDTAYRDEIRRTGLYDQICRPARSSGSKASEQKREVGGRA